MYVSLSDKNLGHQVISVDVRAKNSVRQVFVGCISNPGTMSGAGGINI